MVACAMIMALFALVLNMCAFSVAVKQMCQGPILICQWMHTYLKRLQVALPHSGNDVVTAKTMHRYTK